MVNCRDIDPLVAPYVDGGISGKEREEVALHLDACPPCKSAAAEQAAAYMVLRARAEALVPHAPLGLRAGCAAAARRQARLSWWRVGAMPLAAAAVVVLAVAATLYATRGTAASLATQLTLDHLKCFTLMDEPAGRVDPVALSASLEATYGFTVRVPDSTDEYGLSLLGARRCLTADGRVAHILYRHDGHDLSLFVIPGHERQARAVSVIAHQAIFWSKDGTSYAVVGREPEAQLRRATYYLQRELR